MVVAIAAASTGMVAETEVYWPAAIACVFVAVVLSLVGCIGCVGDDGDGFVAWLSYQLSVTAAVTDNE